MRTGMLKPLIQSGRSSSEPPSLHLYQEASSEALSLWNVFSAESVRPCRSSPTSRDPLCPTLPHPRPECLEPLTKHLGPREGRELLQAAEEVAVREGQVSVQLAEVTVPLPDHHLRGTGTWQGQQRGRRPSPPPAWPRVKAGLVSAESHQLLLLCCLQIWNGGNGGMGPLLPRSLTSLTSSGSLLEMN